MFAFLIDPEADRLAIHTRSQSKIRVYSIVISES